MKRFFTIVTFLFLLTSHTAFAQTISSGTFTSVEGDIISLTTRPPSPGSNVYSMHVVISMPLNVTCLSQPNLTAARWTVIFSDRPDFKLVKDTVHLAFALKKKVRVHANQCALFSSTDANNQYPIIFGVDTL